MVAGKGSDIERNGTGGENDFFGGEEDVVCPDDFELFRVFKGGASPVNDDLIRLQKTVEAAADIRDDLVFALFHLVVGKGDRPRLDPEFSGLLHLVENGGPGDESLRRDTPHIQTNSPQISFLDQRDRFAQLGRFDCRDIAARP